MFTPTEDVPRTAHQLVLQTLRRAILAGSVRPGSRLVQAEIADDLKVSTTPVREALRDLAAEGLIQLDAHRGALVREFSRDEVEEIYLLRSLLEPEAMRQAAARITPEELDRAADVQAQMDAEEDPGRWVELNRTFHGLLATAGKLPRLASILQRLGDVAAMYVGLSLHGDTHALRAGDRDHRELLEALRVRDADGAARIVLRHLATTVEALHEVEPALP